MARFYVLPPRPVVQEQFAQLVRSLLPGLPQRSTIASAWLDSLTTLVETDGCGYVVHREDLPTGVAIGRALVDGFGATAGDVVVEVRPGASGFQDRQYELPADKSA